MDLTAGTRHFVFVVHTSNRKGGHATPPGRVGSVGGRAGGRAGGGSEMYDEWNLLSHALLPPKMLLRYTKKKNTSLAASTHVPSSSIAATTIHHAMRSAVKALMVYIYQYIYKAYIYIFSEYI